MKQAWRRRLTNPPHSYHFWLTSRGSLTQRIQMRCSAFSVRHVWQKLAQPCRDESALVSARRGELVMLREVNLYCGETPVVFAHSVLGRRSLRGAWCSISRQVVKPLAALFANPLVKRTLLYFKKLTAHHGLYHRACRLLKTPPNHLWARRSVFILRDRPVMVTEIFLPGILELSR